MEEKVNSIGQRPIFPLADSKGAAVGGMTLREFFLAHVLGGILAGQSQLFDESRMPPGQSAQLALTTVDALIKALDQEKLHQGGDILPIKGSKHLAVDDLDNCWMSAGS